MSWIFSKNNMKNMKEQYLMNILILFEGKVFYSEMLICLFILFSFKWYILVNLKFSANFYKTDELFCIASS
jgi:hypothetical protein